MAVRGPLLGHNCLNRASLANVSCFTASSALFASSNENVTARGRKFNSWAKTMKSRVLLCQVGLTANLALAPEQLVVVEGWHLIQMNRVFSSDNSPLSEGSESVYNDFSTWSEGNGAIKLGGGALRLRCRPRWRRTTGLPCGENRRE